MSAEDEKYNMHRRRITLADGRYLIFYTFEERGATLASDAEETGGERREPPAAAVAATPQAEEERSV